MPFREDILNPIPGDNPGGADLRYDPVYDKIKEARREDDNLDQGAWKRERKMADWALVIKLCETELATRSKDLQLASWLMEAAIRKQSFPAMIEGCALMGGLIENFWEHLFPALEDGDSEFRATPLDWLVNQLSGLLKTLPLDSRGHSFLQYKESREIAYEADCESDTSKELRASRLNEGKLPPEEFDAGFKDTKKVYYVTLDANVSSSLVGAKSLAKICDDRFGDYAPSFSKLFQSIEEIRQVTKSLLEKKRELEPDPIPETAEDGAVAASATSEGEMGEGPSTSSRIPTFSISAFDGSEPASRKPIIEALVQAASELRRQDPTNPGAYLILRGMRFGELRAAAARGETRSLEAPPTELRRQLRIYLLDQKWKQLLELSEASLVHPSSRGWLDLHRMSAEACVGLGGDYLQIATAIRGEIRALLQDVPEIRTATLMDDTPACNAQTLAWLDEIDPPVESEFDMPQSGTSKSAWSKRLRDPFQVAVEALRKGEKARALEVMRNEIETAPSNRAKFLRQMQVAELCIQAGAREIAQPFLDDIRDRVKDFRLAEWEDRGLVVQALADLYLYHEDTINTSGDRNLVFQQICRLDPVRALGLKA